MGLRVVHVVRQFYPSRGGMEDVVYNIARFQREWHGHHSSVITLDRVFRIGDMLPGDEIFNGIPIKRLPYRGSERYPVCFDVLKHLHDADVVHVHGIDFFYDFLSLTRGLHGKPLIASTHGGFFHTAFAQRMKKLFFHTVTRATSHGYRRILATSANDYDIFSKIVGRERLRVIENGVDIEKYADAAASTQIPTLIYFGRWSSNKGLPESLQLLKNLIIKDPRWNMIIAGREYDFSAAQLQDLAESLGIASALRIVPNPSDDKLRELMGQASYFICLSHHEGFGLAAVEAMSAGLIPLLSEIPPYIKLAQETRVPLLITNDLNLSADAVMTLHQQDENKHQALRQLAQNEANRFGWRSAIDLYAQEYEKAFASAKPPRATALDARESER